MSRFILEKIKLRSEQPQDDEKDSTADLNKQRDKVELLIN